MKPSGHSIGKNEMDQVSGINNSKNHTFIALLRGHKDPLVFPISSAEQDRLFRLVQDEDSDNKLMSFVVFDSEGFRIALNLSELVYCHFLFDFSSPGAVTDESPSHDNNEGCVTVYLCGSQKHLDFVVDSDKGNPEDEDDEGDFRSILFMIELSPSPSHRYHFIDVDGESVFLRAGDISLMKVPLWVIDPAQSLS